MSNQLILNRNPTGLDVLHADPALEQCQTDDAKSKVKVDVRTADALLASHQARRCEHCWSDE